MSNAENRRRLRRLARWMRALPHHAESVAAALAPEIWGELNRMVRDELIPAVVPQQRGLADWFRELGLKFLDFVRGRAKRALEILASQWGGPPPEELFWRLVSSKIEEGMEEWATTYWQAAFNPRGIAEAIARAIEAGLGIEEAIWAGIARSGFRYHVVERGIRTVVVSSLNESAYQAYIANGATRLKWVSTKDKRTRGMRPHDAADHVRMNGVEVPVGTPFRTPRGWLLRYPGDRGLGAPPAEWVNCRCTVVPVFKEEG